jgi:hypothetical protein
MLVVRAYSKLLVEQLNMQCMIILKMQLDANSPTFDEDSDGTIKSLRFSSGLETMDGVKYDNFNPLTLCRS